LRLYVYIIRRLLLMLFVLFALSLLIFYLTRGLLPPTSALAAYITPRMDDAAKLSVARGLGVISATHNNKLPDHLSRVVSLGGYSIPQFWFGAVLQILFVLYVRVNGLGLLATSSAVSTSCGICFANPGNIATYSGAPVVDAILSLNGPYLWDSLLALVLPALTLAVTSVGAITRIVRSSMVDALRQDYITMARSKGLKERAVVYRHALRNAVLPAVTIAGLLVSYLMGGVVVVEIVFSWPGVGNASLAAANVLDVNFLELYVLITAIIIVVTNLFVDVVYGVLDPRIRL
jgi:ABC-type dipeptide/oligopeptide/nickel transport system permease component